MDFKDKHINDIKVNQHIEKAVGAHKKLDKALNDLVSLGGEHAEALNLVEAPYFQARQGLEKVGELGASGWTMSAGADQKAFEAAKKTYEETSATYQNFLSGSHKVKVASGSEIAAPKELVDAYTTASHKTNLVEKVKPVAEIATSGKWADTVKNNFAKINPLEKNRPKAGAGEIAIRGGSVLLGGGMVIDAFVRGKNKDGEQRSGSGRFVEGLAGVGIGAAGLLVGSHGGRA